MATRRRGSTAKIRALERVTLSKEEGRIPLPFLRSFYFSLFRIFTFSKFEAFETRFDRVEKFESERRKQLQVFGEKRLEREKKRKKMRFPASMELPRFSNPEIVPSKFRLKENRRDKEMDTTTRIFVEFNSIFLSSPIEEEREDRPSFHPIRWNDNCDELVSRGNCYFYGRRKKLNYPSPLYLPVLYWVLSFKHEGGKGEVLKDRGRYLNFFSPPSNDKHLSCSKIRERRGKTDKRFKFVRTGKLVTLKLIPKGYRDPVDRACERIKILSCSPKLFISIPLMESLRFPLLSS